MAQFSIVSWLILFRECTQVQKQLFRQSTNSKYKNKKMASLSLLCKSRRFKTANTNNFIHKFNEQKLAIALILVSGLS